MKNNSKSSVIKKLWIIIIVAAILCLCGCETDNVQEYDEKPVIYLYPESETEVTLQLGKPQNITCSYPLYNLGWNVKANENGDLLDLQTGRELYCLYYECKSDVDFQLEDEGFVVKGNDITQFLEEKLEILGLNETETEEFIIYWLPVLQKNEYNYIRFASSDEINEVMPLSVSPKPDSVIRVLMTYKALQEPVNVKPQQLEAPDREGFAVVEWGAAEIK